MEKLTFLPNGQWLLTKAIPDPEFHDQGAGYGLDLTLPNGQYTDKHLNRIQDVCVKESNDLNRVKHMTNHETGKTEPHVLVHYGLTNINHEKKGKGKEWKDFNQFNILNDGKIHVPGNQGAVVSQDVQYSHRFAKPDPEADTSPDSRLMSFWVPKSKIASYASYKEPYNGTLGEDKYVDPDENYLARQKNSSEFNPELEDEEEIPEQVMSDHAMNYGHTRIHPGKYSPASWEEVENGNKNNIHEELKDSIKQLHHQTHKTKD